MRKGFGMIVAAVLLLTMLWLPLEARAEEVAGGSFQDRVTWSLDDSGTLTISGTGYVDRDMGQLPWVRDVKKVVVEEGITALGDNAFNGYVNVTAITLPDTLTGIGSYAFKRCEKLEQLHIPEGVTYIGSNAFAGCSLLREINIPDGVTTIWGATFQDCSSLAEIQIPLGVTKIEGRAFSGCSSLESIELPSGITEIEEGTFSGCSSLRVVSIPFGVTYIAPRAFADCTGLKTVWLPGTVEELALDSFAGCDNIRRVMYGSSRGRFFDLVYAQLKNEMAPEDHSLYTPRLFARCIVTGMHSLDVALVVASRVFVLLLILGAGALIAVNVIRAKQRRERIL